MDHPSPLLHVLLHCPASPAGMLYPMLQGCLYGLTGAAKRRPIADNYNSRKLAVHLYQGRYISRMLRVFGSVSVRISHFTAFSRQRKVREK